MCCISSGDGRRLGKPPSTLRTIPGASADSPALDRGTLFRTEDMRSPSDAWSWRFGLSQHDALEESCRRTRPADVYRLAAVAHEVRESSFVVHAPEQPDPSDRVHHILAASQEIPPRALPADVVAILENATYSWPSIEGVVVELGIAVEPLTDDHIDGFGCWVGDIPIVLIAESLSGADRDAELAHQFAHLICAYRSDVKDVEVHGLVAGLLAAAAVQRTCRVWASPGDLDSGGWMSARYVVMPFEVKLSQEAGWDRPDPNREKFRTLRFHLMFDDHPVRGKRTCMGDRLSAHYAEDAQVDLVRSIEVDMSVVRLEESVRQAVFTNELLDEVSNSLSLGLGKGGILESKAAIKQMVTEKISGSVSELSRIEHTVTESVRQTFEVKYNFTFQPGMSVVNVAMYERRAVDVYVVWVDFLDVHYERTTARLRKKRVKTPAFVEGRTAAQNEVELGMAIGSFEYWKILPESPVMVREENYKNQVKDPGEVRRVEIRETATIREQESSRRCR